MKKTDIIVIITLVVTLIAFVAAVAGDAPRKLVAGTGILFGFSCCLAVMVIGGSGVAKKHLERIEKLERDLTETE